jgi:hypothetical protein
VPVTALDVAKALPDIDAVRDRSRALAMLDAILCPDWESRYYSFDATWAPGEQLASMRDGSGGDYSIVFSAAGAFVRCFDHESQMSPYATGGALWPGLVESVPEAFATYVTEPAFSTEPIPGGGDVLRATACLWRETGDGGWHSGDIVFPADTADGEDDNADPDGADWLLDLLTDPSPTGYVQFAEEYFEVQLDVQAVRLLYALTPLTEALVQWLNPQRSLADLTEDIAEIGYPS